MSEFCQAIQPGHSNVKTRGCVRRVGHKEKMHLNGKFVRWMRSSDDCENCGALATTSDDEGVPLCAECKKI
jgi:hypothetical protein